MLTHSIARRYTRILVVVWMAGNCFAAVAAAPRSRVVLIEPVVLCDDDGANPARWKLVKRLVDQVYTKCDLEFFYTEPRFWHFGAGRRGEVNLNTIVSEGRSQGVIRGGRQVVTMFFVDAIDGRAALMGRGMQNGNITFVCLGKGEIDEGVNNFVIAHEVGHNFNLRHAVDDPNVPNDVPNVQGDGPYEDRLGIDGINAYQRDVVLRNPVVVSRTHFASKKEGITALEDQTVEPYIAAAWPNCLRATFNDRSMSNDPKEARKEAIAKLPKMVMAFTDPEKKAIQSILDEIFADLDDEWPLLTRFPWHFVKVSGEFCGSFPHTRGRHIIVSEPMLRHLGSDPVRLREILMHEKLHVVQRFYPKRFEALARSFGFSKLGKLQIPDVISEQVMPNPDGMSHWAIPKEKKYYLPLTTLDPEIMASGNRPPMPSAFRGMAFEVMKVGAGNALNVADALAYPKAFPEHRKRYGWLPHGHDHPNEVAAYALPYIDPALASLPQNPKAAKSADIQHTSKMLPTILSLGPENLPAP